MTAGTVFNMDVAFIKLKKWVNWNVLYITNILEMQMKQLQRWTKSHLKSYEKVRKPDVHKEQIDNLPTSLDFETHGFHGRCYQNFTTAVSVLKPGSGDLVNFQITCFHRIVWNASLPIQSLSREKVAPKECHDDFCARISKTCCSTPKQQIYATTCGRGRSHCKRV